MSRTAPDLSALRCNGPNCPDRRRLSPDAEPGWVKCEACGQRAGGAGLFKPYAARTGNWIVAFGVMMSLGLSRGGFSAGWGSLGFKWVLAGAGAVELAVIVWRIVYQARTLKALRRP